MKRRILFVLSSMAVFGLSFLNAQNFEVYICDAENFTPGSGKILKFDQDGENGEVFIDNNLSWPQDIFFIEEENVVLISNLSANSISRFDATTGDFIDVFASGIAGPTRMEQGADGLLYVLQWGNNKKVLRYNLDGTLESEFSQTNVSTAIGMDWDMDGNLYVSSFGEKYVRKFSPTGEDLGNFISANLVGPTNIWFAENGDLMVIDYNGNSVKRFSPEGEYLGMFITGLPNGEGVDFFPNGDLMIGSGGTSSVRIYDSEGNFLNDFVPAGTAGLMTPNAVVFRPVEMGPSAAQEELFQEMTLVTPTVGAHFTVSDMGALGQLDSFQVYDSAGREVSRLHLAAGQNWDASALADGAYFIMVKFPDGTMARQKILVKK